MKSKEFSLTEIHYKGKLKLVLISLAKVNIIDPTKDNLTQPLSIKVILDKYNKQSLDDIEK